MASLPTVGADSGAWGTELNAYLLVSHDSAGRHAQQFNVYDYGTAATDVSINAAITACQSAGGGVVQLEAITYSLSAGLVTSADNVILRGRGVQTVLQPVAGSNFDVISTPIPAVSGTAGYTRNYLGIEALHIDCSLMSGTTAGQGNGIHWYGVRYGYIRDCLITSSPNWSIILDGDATPNFGYNCEVRGNTFDLCAAGVLHSGSEAHEIVQNKFKYAKTATAAAQPAFSSPSTTAMHLWCTGGYNYIAGNVFGNSGTYTSEAVRLANSGPSKVIGNRFDQTHAEAIRCTSGNQIIVGNQIGNPGSTVAGKSGILLGASNNVVMGNKFDITNGAAAYAYCVSEPSAQSNNIITGNSFVAGLSGVVSLNASSTGDVVANNLGYNPVGQVTAPAFPATTVGVTNNTGAHVHAYIANGTGAITVIQVAGVGGAYVTTGYQIAASGWGSVRIPAGGSVKFTYASGSPTWTWFGD